MFDPNMANLGEDARLVLNVNAYIASYNQSN